MAIKHALQNQLFLCAYPHTKRVMSEACVRVITCHVRAFTLFPKPTDLEIFVQI